MNKPLKLIISTIALSASLFICGKDVQAIDSKNLKSEIYKDLGTESNINDEDLIKQQINKYFEAYYKSLETFEKPNYEGIVQNNSDTKIITTATELHVEQNKLGNLKYQNTNIKVDVDTLDIDGSQANVNVKVTCTYNYSTAPNYNAGTYGTKYSFGLEKIENKWLITMLDTDDELFDSLKETINEKKSNSRTKRDLNSNDIIIENAKQELLNEAELVVKNLGGSPTADKSPKEPKEEASSIRTKRAASYTSFPYESFRGVFYTKVHAENPNSWFYYLGGVDCTNFVSQCLWYSYGGINEGISSKSRMSSTWYASKYGGSSSWESVEGLWNHVVNNYPGHGPNGTGYNNNQPYYNFAPGRIYVGEVLQINNINNGNGYTHSVYVVHSNNGSNKYYNEILVAQHSNNYKERNLYELILNSGGNSCYMRDIAFTSANLYGGPGSN